MPAILIVHDRQDLQLPSIGRLALARLKANEDEHYAIEPASDADMLRHLMEASGITQAQLSRVAKLPKSTIAEILARKKPFSRQTIRKLADYFRVDVRVLATNFCTLATPTGWPTIARGEGPLWGRNPWKDKTS